MSTPKTPNKKTAGVKASGRTLVCENRKAGHSLQIEETFEAGIALVGTEVKAMRAGRAHLSEAYVQVVAGQAVLIGGHIGEYSHGNQFNHAPSRSRRLLLHRAQIDKLSVKLGQQGYTALPMALYFNEVGLVKLSFGIGRGKGARDKRADIKARDADVEVARALRRGNR